MTRQRTIAPSRERARTAPLTSDFEDGQPTVDLRRKRFALGTQSLAPRAATAPLPGVTPRRQPRARTVQGAPPAPAPPRRPRPR